MMPPPQWSPELWNQLEMPKTSLYNGFCLDKVFVIEPEFIQCLLGGHSFKKWCFYDILHKGQIGSDYTCKTFRSILSSIDQSKERTNGIHTR